ncbi:MAG: hypothetical protein HC902_02220 [Calothrix sp. SM1_5_4]|nr:hypothetical protein [Calothrix sp. SM1_5_4]
MLMMNSKIHFLRAPRVAATAMALVTLFLLTPSADARRSGCGKGCQRSMGQCTVNSALWNAAMTARQAGVRLTSCCRSPAYNAQLRACGYKPSPSSSHMSGNAIDLLVSPSRCNRRSLSAYGFANVCPDYHAGHCHISQCGTAQTYRKAKAAAQDRARRHRQENYRSSSQAPRPFFFLWPFSSPYSGVDR